MPNQLNGQARLKSKFKFELFSPNSFINLFNCKANVIDV